jgi:glycosyltransferase involved in cell wall biosynthesis
MITFNNARTVEKALQCLEWADDIVVVDSFSKDETPEIARRYATTFEQRKWPGHCDQYQYAMDLCRHDWCIFVDADEVLSPELIEEIRAEFARNLALPESERTYAYHIHRLTWYLGRWIRHGGWLPDYELRLCHRQHARWGGGLHAKLETKAKSVHLKQVYYHYTYADISDQLQTIDNYSGTASADMQAAGKTFSWIHLIGNPLVRFVRDYIFKRGFLDGFPGFVIAVNTMFYVFIKHAKLWERQHIKEGDNS